MKSDNLIQVTGDVIGNTAYSQRFVIKVLLNLANDKLKDENESKVFEDDLCTLWDMTTEKDVALFLHEHNALNLIYFALPTCAPRIKEILIGIVGNMCCQKRVTSALLNMDSFIMQLFEYLNSDDTALLIQLLRLMSTCLSMSEPNDLALWMDMFVATEHSSILYFILEYCADRELLHGALEHFNNICGYFNTDAYRTQFYTHFVKVEALKSLATAFKEITENQPDDSERHDLELVLVRSLQIAVNLVGFDNSPIIYKDNKQDILTIITPILKFYTTKLNECEIDLECIDIIDTINTLVNVLKISEICEPEKYFKQTFEMWKTVHTFTNIENKCEFEDEDTDKLKDVMLKLKVPLSTLICTYIGQCSEENMLKVLDNIGKYYDELVISLTDSTLAADVTKRVDNSQSRLVENGNS